MPETPARRRPPNETARTQHKELILTTAARLERYARQVQIDVRGGKPALAHAHQMASAITVLLMELAALAARTEDAARARREAAA